MSSAATLAVPSRRNSFFFSSYEALAQGVPQNFTGTVPTAAMKQGDFSASAELMALPI